MVRQLASSPQGVPLELYCFTATTAWAEYENIQADIFDHLIALLPEFGLALFQQPSGQDVRAGLAALAARHARSPDRGSVRNGILIRWRASISAWAPTSSRRRHLRAAIGELRARFGAITVSPVYRSRSVGFDGTDFVNLAVGLDTELCRQRTQRLAARAGGPPWPPPRRAALLRSHAGRGHRVLRRSGDRGCGPSADSARTSCSMPSC